MERTWKVLLALAAALVAPAAAQAARVKPPPPLVLAEDRSFFVNPKTVTGPLPGLGGKTTEGHFSARGMYVHVQAPVTRDRRLPPIVLVPGASHTGAAYETTPDGRMGWAEYFVRHGAAVYVVEQAGRGRSGFPAPVGGAASPAYPRFSNEQAWTIFRFGPKPFVPYPGVQFPLESVDAYFAQLVPDTETAFPDVGGATVEALEALLDQIGPAVVVVHSQSGAYGLRAAAGRPGKVAALVTVEPRSCAATDAEITGPLRRTPVLALFGDFFGDDIEDWPGRLKECRDTVGKLAAAGDRAEAVYLPDRGIRGNSHMMMMDRNNLQLAGLILDWLRGGRGKR